MSAAHTPGPWHVGAQNDLLFVTAGREPALNNDHPWHDAPRVAVARMFEAAADDCLPIDAHANARLMATAPEMLDLLRTILPANVCLTNRNVPDHTIVPLDAPMGELRALAALIAKATGQ